MNIKAKRLLALASFAALTALPAAAQYYDVTNVDLGGGSYNLRIAGINANGQVAGGGYTATGEYHPFVASRSTGTVDIGAPGSTYSFATALNASGQVVGVSFVDPDGDGISAQRAFFWSKTGGIVDLGTLGGRWAVPNAINDAGTVIGVSETAAGNQSAFGWNATIGMYALGTAQGTDSYAAAINASGQSVGTNWTGYGLSTAILWNAGGGGNGLGALSGATNSEAFAISDAGYIMGRSTWLDSNYNTVQIRPFLYTEPTGMIDIGTLGGISADVRAMNRHGRVIGISLTASNKSEDVQSFTFALGSGLIALTLGGRSFPNDVSSLGQVVGWSATAGGATHGFSWTQAGGIVDVGTFGGSSSIAYGATNTGQAIGRAALPNDTNTHAFLFENGVLRNLNDLTPDKPAGLELLAAALPADNGSMIAVTNTGYALLSPSSTSAAPPVVAPISANDPVAVGAVLSVSANFTDAAADTHTATFAFGDGTPPQAATVSETNGSGTASGAHTYTTAGVYPVLVTVTDNGGLKSHVTRNVVVYDPSAGFVTGSGWLLSPAGAYRPDVAAMGEATFSFVSKYQKGATAPTGTTEFRFQTANLEFHSDAYDWLVVGGARAQFKGTGSLNDTAGYKFMLTAVDGKVTGTGSADRFRIKISRYDENLKQDVVVYDNQISSAAEGTLSEGTALGGGNIVVHAAKNY